MNTAKFFQNVHCLNIILCNSADGQKQSYFNMNCKTSEVLSAVKEEVAPGLCRCCLEEGMYKSIYNSINSYGGNSDTYGDMVYLCFALNISIPGMKDDECYICDLCIIRLKDAFAFKSQVEDAQKVLQKKIEYERRRAVETELESVKLKKEHVDTDDEWNLEYLEEYKDVVTTTDATNEETSKKRQRRTYHKSKSADGKTINDRHWQKALLSKICKIKMQCLICLEQFQNVHILMQHLNVHYPNYICDTCGKAFASKRRIDAHSRVHDKGDYKCDDCKMTFDTKCKWQNHTAKHRKSLRYCCPLCAKRFKDFFQRQKHLVAEHGKPKKAFLCKRCDSSFATAGHRSSHVRRVHLQERSKICSVCGMSFFAEIELRDHMVVHSGVRSFKCDVCQKAYPRLKTLREHKKIHTNDKRFICSVCNRSFTQKCTLKGHMKTHDRSVSNYEETRKVDPTGQVFIYMDVIKEEAR